MKVNVIGAGLAGVEASYYLANKGVDVTLYEMRPKKSTEAHHSNKFAELVCSNSLRSNDINTAPGLMKSEMTKLNSLIIKSAIINEVPAGGALAVDREGFSEYITEEIKNHKNITIVYDEVKEIDGSIPTIICTGPLTSDTLSHKITELIGQEQLYFFDAAAPIITHDSINMDIVYKKSRYDKGEAAYLNCPMTKEQYEVFYNNLINAECIEPKDFELKVFEGCMPVEVMAKRGEQTLLFGPLKPVGLMTPTGEKPYAVVQLRQDDAVASLYNLVGFQTHMKFGEQKKVIQSIPGLENAEIVRYGVMHRNSFINSTNVLNAHYQLKTNPNLFFAGQLTGVEGYIESASSGIVAAINMYRYLNNEELIEFPVETAMGSMAKYITTPNTKFQPMNTNFGIIKDLDMRVKKKERKAAYSLRAQEVMDEFIKNKLND